MIKTEEHFLNVIPDEELKDSFLVRFVEEQHQDPEITMCRTAYHRIFLIIEGSGNLLIDDQSYPLTGNQLFLLSKGQLYGFRQDTIISGYELRFGDCFWEKTPASANNCKAVLFNNAAANQCLPITDEGSAALQVLFSTILKEYESPDYINKPDVLAAYLKVIMIKIANLHAALTDAYDNHEKQLYRRFIAALAIHYKTTHEVAFFAKELGISTRKLTDICRNCCGSGAKELINGQLIAEARRALQFSSRPVKDIAYALNFSSPDQFSHFFKKHTGTAPNDYRIRFVEIGM